MAIIRKGALIFKRVLICTFTVHVFHLIKKVACEQAVRGTLVAAQEKEGELVAASLKFEYPH